METFSILLYGEQYKVSFHPDIRKFMIIKHRSGLHILYQHYDNKWQSINSNSISTKLPVNCLYNEVMCRTRIGYHITLM